MKTFQIHSADNVAVLLEGSAQLDAGQKIALCDIPTGGTVIKYGSPIGVARAAICTGEHVHTQNLKTGLGALLDYAYEPNGVPLPPHDMGMFFGFCRANDQVGIRNEIWIIPTVGCVNSIAHNVARAAQTLVRGSVEGIYAFGHPYGCSQLGEDHEYTKKALCGLIRHPNAGGVLVLGLGCENNHINGMKAELGDYDKERVKFLNLQDVSDDMDAALACIQDLAAYAGQFRRESVPMSKLVVGLKCGGSDGFSGITANPLVGKFCDRLVAGGGTALLTEVPEMFGAETLLMNRCRDRTVFEKTVALINGFKNYFQRHEQPIYENPSPGNKAGGITTLEEKSLGCTQKSGSALVEDVLLYTEPVRRVGLHLLQGPGNDLVASSATVISGAHLVLFTTGRGTPFGAPAPTVKISSNSTLYQKKGGWIDFDAGRLLSGVTLETLTEELLEYVRALASGQVQTKTEQNDIREVAIFKDGVTL